MVRRDSCAGLFTLDQDELNGDALPVLIEFDTVYYYQMANLNDHSPYKGSFKTA